MNAKKRFIILTTAVSVSGFSQGLLLPLLSVLLEKQGVSSSVNGLSSSLLYIGMLVSAPFIEWPVRKYGYKITIIFGIFITSIAIILFPLWLNVYYWMVLRFIVGIGDSAIHFATQTWITATAESFKRGRVISLYGFSYGIGFGIGPLGLILLPLGYWIPFIVAAVLFFLILTQVFKVDNEKPEQALETKADKRYIKVYVIAGVALLPMFIYGLLEATLNTSFPIYGLRTGMSAAFVSILLSSFVIGSLVFQLPLGYLSDYIGRRRVLMLTTFIGGIFILCIPNVHSNVAIILIFLLTGGLVGSLFSLGLAYVADLIPPNLLPTANLIAGIHFGVGSMIGPYFGGIFISNFQPKSLFYFIAVVVFSFVFFAMIGSVSRSFKALNRKNESY